MKLPVNLEGVSSLSRSLQRVDAGLLEQPVESFSAAAGRLFRPFVDFLTMLLVSTGRWIFAKDPPIASNSVFLNADIHLQLELLLSAVSDKRGD